VDLLPLWERVISLAGSYTSLDTAIVVIETQNTTKILDLKLRKIILMLLSREKFDAEYLKKRTHPSNL
jgi:hypothetical protein